MNKKLIITFLCTGILASSSFAAHDDLEKLKEYANLVAENNKKLAQSNKDLTENNDTLVSTNRSLVNNNKSLTESNIQLQRSQFSLATRCVGAGIFVGGMALQQ